uniref:Protein kinase domain-containing protein n=1 Tax=Mucochytrium quahogii TaxID=96639 RepID=A0A7S2RDE6_9STRA|mmetsp:Transcript_14875/g.26003  ORF Transcript_14875/g.26003 Transcript_14875/m.26003 type:complete len:421 (-) Transcript_14875:1285-2547(-)
MELDNLTSSLDDIYQEVRVMLLSSNPCVLKAYACFVVKRSLWLVMPLMRKGSCLRIMRVLKKAGLGEGMKEEWIATILKSALIGLEYFHKQAKVHRDIKASNLLMDSDGTVMISDFGVAGWLPNGQDRKMGERRTFVGTPCWMAPEVMEQTQPYDEKADIWSFGITALELAKGYAPYARLQPMKVLLMTIQNPPPSLKSYDDYQKSKSKFSRHFREIITLCLQKNASHRPSASTLLTKTFFKRAPATSSLVKDLLEAVPVPDTCESFTGSGQSATEKREVQKELELIQQQQKEEIEKQKMKELQQQENIEQPGKEVSKAQAVEAAIAKLESMPGSSFVKGATWVFDEDVEGEEAASPAPDQTEQQTQEAAKKSVNAAVVDDMSGFEAFASEYAKMHIKGEDGKTQAAGTPPEPPQTDGST